MNYICILPVGEIREEILISLGKGLEEVFGFLYRISPPTRPAPIMVTLFLIVDVNMFSTPY